MITKNKKHPELDVELKRRVKAASKTGKLDVSTTPNCQFQFKYVPSLVYSTFGVKKDEVINASETKTGTAAVAANNNNTNKTSSSDVADLREWVRNAPGQKPSRPENRQGMMSFAEILNGPELDDIVSYLQTLGGKPPLMPS